VEGGCRRFYFEIGSLCNATISLSHPSLPLTPLAMGLSALPLIPLGSMIDRNAIAVAIVLSVLSVVFLSIALLM
jgi:hypothetical protein